jgi:pimeloyl-ACP methyl ester carboxylesterase
MKAFFLKWLQRSAVALLSSVIVAIVLFFAAHAYFQSKVREEIRITSPNGIESLEKVSIGGVTQWILIRGHDKSKPLLLFLHGGPGFPLMPFFHPNTLVEKEFIIVHWDQRGAGKSYSSTLPEESIKIEQFIADTHELIQILRQRFGVPRIYLVGHSWGSILGMLTINRYPELFYAYVGIGQVADMQENQMASFQFALQSATRAGNQKAVQELTTVGNVGKKWVIAFGGNMYGESDLWKLVQLGFSSPYHSLLDFKKIIDGTKFSGSALGEELSQINLFQQVPKVEVPVYFLEGRHDYMAPSYIAERYYQMLNAPKGKKLFWFDQSGHWPQLEEPNKFHEILINTILKETFER